MRSSPAASITSSRCRASQAAAILTPERCAGRCASRRRSSARPIASDACFRLRTDLLEAAIDADRRAGLVPFAVVSSAGTTNTGAVDPLDAIADICARESVWHHIDGAYGAFFYLCAELRGTLR